MKVLASLVFFLVPFWYWLWYKILIWNMVSNLGKFHRMLCSRTDGWKSSIETWTISCVILCLPNRSDLFWFKPSERGNVIHEDTKINLSIVNLSHKPNTNKHNCINKSFRIVVETSRILWSGSRLNCPLNTAKSIHIDCFSYSAGSWLTTQESKMQVIHVFCVRVTLCLCFWSAWSDMIAGQCNLWLVMTSATVSTVMCFCQLL